MMSIIFFLSGVSLLIFIAGDFLATVFLQKGAGYLTRAVTVAVAKVFKKLAGNNGNHPILEYKVVVIILFMIITWLFLVWMAVSMIFFSDTASVINTETNEPSSYFEKMYFAGYTLSTMGLGDYKPNGVLWQQFTSIVSFSGFTILTISITYIVPVINNITQKKILSLRISSLGRSVNEILFNGYEKDSFSPLEQQLNSQAHIILTFAKNHSAYPILHHVHTVNKDENAVLRLVLLDEVLNILQYHIPPEKKISNLILMQIRTAISVYLDSLRYITPSEKPPPLPDFATLEKNLGFKLMNTAKADIQKIYSEDVDARRRLLSGLIDDDGFRWDEIEEGN
jgi:hypothetical protein